MKPEDIRNLLGGYASGTLSEEEKRILFSAALEDQTLFDALAEEQALKEVLDDSESRGYLRAVLEESPPQEPDSLTLRARTIIPAAPVPPPATASVVANTGKASRMVWGLAMAAVLVGVTTVGLLRMNRTPEARPVEVAVVKPVPVPPPVEVREAPPADKPVPIPARKLKTSEEKPVAAEATADRKRDNVAPASPVPGPPPQVAEQAPAPAAASGQLVNVEAASANVQAVQSKQQQVLNAPVPGQSAAHGPMQESNSNAVFRNSITADQAALMNSRASAFVPMEIGYGLLRQAETGEFEAVPLSSKFKEGDVVKLAVRARPGLRVEVRRADSNQVLPLEARANYEVRTGPITIQQASELTITVNRLSALATPLVPPSQLKKDAGMTYINEPLAADAPLVIRVPLTASK